ncbi:MAG: PLP-dependent aminotransferase family protein [Lachnospiraceae bacterium]|nr:PLP-dependent aminotransferase family protein [Lachnospiraceae bacterium]
MITYSFTDIGSETLYQHLYHCLKNDIVAGNLKENDRLPSKRSFAKNLGISVITVENAYAQLLAEGYIYSIPKKGFFVETIPDAVRMRYQETSTMEGETESYGDDISPAGKGTALLADFASNRNHPDHFPFSVWAKLSKETMAQDPHGLMTPSPANGVYELRVAICRHLSDFRGMKVDPSQVIIGAGTEYLYSLLIQLLGYDKIYAIENPGYKKLYQIYQSHHVICRAISMDEKGVSMEQLLKSDTDVLHITPAHHFPTGIVTQIGRRYELLNWAAASERRYIIEDDFDSEFRMVGRSIPMLQSIDMQGKVIYMNTFSKSLSSTIRISYMILPPNLAEKFHEKLGFYSCTVSTFDQFILAGFIERGYFEKHINRMRTYYKNLQRRLIENIKNSSVASKVEIAEEEAGLHFLLKLETSLTDRQIVEKAMTMGYRVLTLSECYIRDDSKESWKTTDIKQAATDRRNAVKDTHTLVINYSGMEEEQLPMINGLLEELCR